MDSNLAKVGAIALVAFSFPLLIATNLKRGAYANYFSGQVINETAEFICQEERSCQRVIQGWKQDNLPKQTLNIGINLATKRQNFLFFSIYTTAIPGTNFEFTTLGILGNFIHLSEG